MVTAVRIASIGRLTRPALNALRLPVRRWPRPRTLSKRGAVRQL